MSDEQREIWNGQLMDAGGRQGSFEVHFLADKPLVVWKVQILERDGAPIEMEGEANIEGRDPRQGDVLESREELPDGSVVTWRLELEPAEAGQYARRALLGQYRVSSENPELPLVLSRGVLVLWQFA